MSSHPRKSEFYDEPTITSAGSEQVNRLLVESSRLADEADRILEECLERYSEVAPLEDPSQLKEYLPRADSLATQFVLIELIKLDMAFVSESGNVPRIENYLDALPDHLNMDSVPVDLVMEEIQLRREIGEAPTHDEYQKRFPQFDAVLGQLLGVAEATSAVKNKAAPPELQIGSQIDDFLIIQTLGSGAFAYVYLARQISMHRLVALKVSRGTGDEPQALSQFDHTNIVRVYDQRELDAPPVHLMYMQYHPGGTLLDVVKLVRSFDVDQRDGQLLLDTVDRQLLKAAQVVPERSAERRWIANAQWPVVVAWIGVQLAKALQDAHGRGVMHRDVKPANVLLSAEGIPKLADFNVSFAGAAGRAGAASSFGGSIGYMAPEHLRAISASMMDEPEEVAEAADLYALAIMLWELWQGYRPFAADTTATSWTDAVTQQLQARQGEPTQPARAGNAAERVLEKTLRSALAFDQENRIAGGAEFAGRLKLALHPETARLFDPDEGTIRHRILQLPPWLVPITVLLVPNLAVMAFNFGYNWTWIRKHEEDLPGLETFFKWTLAPVISIFSFGIGVFFTVWLTKAFVAAIDRARSNQPATAESISSITGLGRNAALIGGSLWAIAGLIYPIALSLRFSELPNGELLRFFLSLVICGGVAAIYPYFGMTTLATLAYYPRLVKNAMQDDQFDHRFAVMVRHSERYFIAAAGVPLLGAALLVFSDAEEKGVVLCAVAATMIGLLMAFYAYKSVLKNWSQMARVLSEKEDSAVPGIGSDE